MESVTYVCYNQDDLIAQSKTFLTEIQNIQAALLKVAENDVDAGVLEEIKALLGMDAGSSTPDTTASQATEPVSKSTVPATDTKEPETNATEPTKTTEPATDVKPETHTVIVQAGDTLQTLAEKTGATPRHLIDMNMLMEPVVLRPGQTLKY